MPNPLTKNNNKNENIHIHLNNNRIIGDDIVLEERFGRFAGI